MSNGRPSELWGVNMYYKVMANNEVIDVLSRLSLTRIINKSICKSGSKDATGFMSSDFNKIYHIDGAADGEYYKDGDAVLEEITEEEALLLKEVLESGASVENKDGEDVVVDEPEEDPEEEIEVANAALESLKEWKIKQLSEACKKAIEEGFVIKKTTANGEKEYHYSLKEEDQINILMNMEMIRSGSEVVFYHANSEPTEAFTAETFTDLVKQANYCRTYNVAHFNCLKMWLYDMTDKMEISKVTFNSEIPDAYQTEGYMYICNIYKPKNEADA